MKTQNSESWNYLNGIEKLNSRSPLFQAVTVLRDLDGRRRPCLHLPAVASRRTTGRSRQCVGERSKGKSRELLLLWRIPHFEATLMDSCWSFWWNVGGSSFVSPLSGHAGCFLRWENIFTQDTARLHQFVKKGSKLSNYWGCVPHEISRCQLSFDTKNVFQSISMFSKSINSKCPSFYCEHMFFLHFVSDATCDSSMTEASYLPSVTCSRDHVSQSLSSLAPCKPRDKVRKCLFSAMMEKNTSVFCYNVVHFNTWQKLVTKWWIVFNSV